MSNSLRSVTERHLWMPSTEAEQTILMRTPTAWKSDSNWKLTYPICMYQVPKRVPFGDTLQYVSSCPKQPVPYKAF